MKVWESVEKSAKAAPLSSHLSFTIYRKVKNLITWLGGKNQAIFRSSHSVIKSFVKLTGRHLCGIVFLKKLQPEILKVCWKETPA